MSSLVSFLATEYASLYAEYKKQKNNPHKKVIEDTLHALERLKASPGFLDEEFNRLDVITPLLLISEGTKNSKLATSVVGILQKLITHSAIKEDINNNGKPIETILSSIVSLFVQVVQLSTDVQLRILQSLLPFATHYEALHGDNLVQLFNLCFTLLKLSSVHTSNKNQMSTLRMIHNSSEATVRQLVILVFDKAERSTELKREEKHLSDSNVHLPSRLSLEDDTSLLDAYCLFKDLCLTLRGSSGPFISDDISLEFSLELIESILACHNKLFKVHPLFTELLQDSLCKNMILYFKSSNNSVASSSGIYLRFFRVFAILIREFISDRTTRCLISTELEIFVMILIKLLETSKNYTSSGTIRNESFIDWKTIVSLEIWRRFCHDQKILNGIYELGYFGSTPDMVLKDPRNDLLQQFLDALLKLRQAKFPKSLLSLNDPLLKSPLIDQLEGILSSGSSALASSSNKIDGGSSAGLKAFSSSACISESYQHLLIFQNYLALSQASFFLPGIYRESVVQGMLYYLNVFLPVQCLLSSTLQSDNLAVDWMTLSIYLQIGLGSLALSEPQVLSKDTTENSSNSNDLIVSDNSSSGSPLSTGVLSAWHTHHMIILNQNRSDGYYFRLRLSGLPNNSNYQYLFLSFSYYLQLLILQLAERNDVTSWQSGFELILHILEGLENRDEIIFKIDEEEILDAISRGIKPGAEMFKVQFSVFFNNLSHKISALNDSTYNPESLSVELRTLVTVLLQGFGIHVLPKDQHRSARKLQGLSNSSTQSFTPKVSKNRSLSAGLFGTNVSTASLNLQGSLSNTCLVSRFPFTAISKEAYFKSFQGLTEVVFHVINLRLNSYKRTYLPDLSPPSISSINIQSDLLINNAFAMLRTFVLAGLQSSTENIFYNDHRVIGDQNSDLDNAYHIQIIPRWTKESLPLKNTDRRDAAFSLEAKIESSSSLHEDSFRLIHHLKHALHTIYELIFSSVSNMESTPAPPQLGSRKADHEFNFFALQRHVVSIQLLFPILQAYYQFNGESAELMELLEQLYYVSGRSDAVLPRLVQRLILGDYFAFTFHVQQIRSHDRSGLVPSTNYSPWYASLRLLLDALQHDPRPGDFFSSLYKIGNDYLAVLFSLDNTYIVESSINTIQSIQGVCETDTKTNFSSEPVNDLDHGNNISRSYVHRSLLSLYISCVECFIQRQAAKLGTSLNDSLTAVELLWKVSDVLIGQNKTQEVPLLYLLNALLGLCCATNLQHQVRESSLLTLFRIITIHTISKSDHPQNTSSDFSNSLAAVVSADKNAGKISQKQRNIGEDIRSSLTVAILSQVLSPLLKTPKNILDSVGDEQFSQNITAGKSSNMKLGSTETEQNNTSLTLLVVTCTLDYLSEQQKQISHSLFAVSRLELIRQYAHIWDSLFSRILECCGLVICRHSMKVSGLDDVNLTQPNSLENDSHHQENIHISMETLSVEMNRTRTNALRALLAFMKTCTISSDNAVPARKQKAERKNEPILVSQDMWYKAWMKLSETFPFIHVADEIELNSLQTSNIKNLCIFSNSSWCTDDLLLLFQIIQLFANKYLISSKYDSPLDASKSKQFVLRLDASYYTGLTQLLHWECSNIVNPYRNSSHHFITKGPQHSEHSSHVESSSASFSCTRLQLSILGILVENDSIGTLSANLASLLPSNLLLPPSWRLHLITRFISYAVKPYMSITDQAIYSSFSEDKKDYHSIQNYWLPLAVRLLDYLRHVDISLFHDSPKEPIAHKLDGSPSFDANRLYLHQFIISPLFYNKYLEIGVDFEHGKNKSNISSSKSGHPLTKYLHSENYLESEVTHEKKASTDRANSHLGYLTLIQAKDDQEKQHPVKITSPSQSAKSSNSLAASFTEDYQFPAGKLYILACHVFEQFWKNSSERATLMSFAESNSNITSMKEDPSKQDISSANYLQSVHECLKSLFLDVHGIRSLTVIQLIREEQRLLKLFALFTSLSLTQGWWTESTSSLPSAVNTDPKVNYLGDIFLKLVQQELRFPKSSTLADENSLYFSQVPSTKFEGRQLPSSFYCRYDLLQAALDSLISHVAHIGVLSKDPLALSFANWLQSYAADYITPALLSSLHTGYPLDRYTSLHSQMILKTILRIDLSLVLPDWNVSSWALQLTIAFNTCHKSMRILDQQQHEQLHSQKQHGLSYFVSNSPSILALQSLLCQLISRRLS